jgi:trk system potassium uptake protein TrkA
MSPNVLDHLEVSKGCSIVELVAPNQFVGKSIKDVGVRSKYGVTIVAIHRTEKGREQTIMNPGPNEVIDRGDILVLIGSERDVHRLKLS